MRRNLDGTRHKHQWNCQDYPQTILPEPARMRLWFRQWWSLRPRRADEYLDHVVVAALNIVDEYVKRMGD
jgi:hypothetical protein